VGGYAEKIKDGRSMIFHLESDNASTLELCRYAVNKDGKPVLGISQHKSESNKEPSEMNKSIARELLMYLIEKHHGISREDYARDLAPANDTGRPLDPNITAEEILAQLTGPG
jgi:hypothetical protein